jgi:hypothetical protein
MHVIMIRFSGPEMERRGLGYLAGRYSGKTWASGDTLVPEEALPNLAAAGIEFSVEASPQTFVPDRVREQAAAGFAQFDTGEFESLTREELMSRLARRHAPDA